MAFEKGIEAWVIKEYEASDPDPLVMAEGEVLEVGQRDTTWPAFLRCKNSAGNEGWVPDVYLDVDGDMGVAREAYSAVELTVTVGEIMSLEKEVGGWYWARNEAGELGWVPRECVEKTGNKGRFDGPQDQ